MELKPSTYDPSFQAEAAARRREVEASLHTLFELRTRKNSTARQEAALTELVRGYLDLEGASEIVDPERGVRAYLEPRGTTEWDVASMPDVVVLYLASAGLLTVATRAFEERRKNNGHAHLDAAARFRISGQTFSLKVEKPEARS